jgi:mannose-1-phosphate guanylyltransferase
MAASTNLSFTSGSRRKKLDHVTVLLLAGGDGGRLISLTRDRAGEPAPKQYSVLAQNKTLIQYTYERALRLVPQNKIFAVVSRHHEKWWSRELPLEPERFIVQPENRGTAPGVLLSTLHILMEFPSDVLVALPSDHYVADEAVFENALRLAIRRLKVHPQDLVLLGITPDSMDAEYGWILPRAARRNRLRRVLTFVEKPRPEQAEDLLAASGLWSSFVFVCKVTRLLDLMAQANPQLVGRFLRTIYENRGSEGFPKLYEDLPTFDFSKDILQKCVDSLRALAVPSCGWTDLGTPSRYTEWQATVSNR